MSTDIVKAVFEAMETKDFDKMSAMVTDDFTFSGPVPEPVGKEKWVSLQRALLNGFPDWKFNASFHESGETVHIDVEITGTHDGDLDLSVMGLPNVPATGKSIKLPKGHMDATLSDGKLSSLVGKPTEGGGVMGILSQLGVELPPKS